MSFESEFDELMPDTITWTPVQVDGLGNPVTNGFGDKTYDGTKAKQIACRVEEMTRLVRDKDGKEVPSKTTVYMNPVAKDGSSYVPTVSDLYVLTADYAKPNLVPIDVQRLNDQSGKHHNVVVA